MHVKLSTLCVCVNDCRILRQNIFSLDNISLIWLYLLWIWKYSFLLIFLLASFVLFKTLAMLLFFSTRFPHSFARFRRKNNVFHHIISLIGKGGNGGEKQQT